MKTLKLNHFVIFLGLFLASCATTSYLGDTYPATEKIDVFYDAKDIKQDYKVIGHLAIAYTQNSAEAKNDLSIKAREVGADGIIIFQVSGNNDKATIRADAIKYNK